VFDSCVCPSAGLFGRGPCLRRQFVELRCNLPESVTSKSNRCFSA
jgi:hypothetical protein